MRKSSFVYLVSLLLIINLQNFIFAQNPYQWSATNRLTFGFKDSNPAFASLQTQSTFGLLKWEFLIFQRQIDSSSQICVLKINPQGVADSVRYLTYNNYKNRNPSIAYRIYNWVDSIKSAFAVWETNQNGKWDLYGSYFNIQTGWSVPFPIDTTSASKFSPKAMMTNASDAGIYYERNNDIIYRRFNAATGTFISEKNITSGIAQNCVKPFIASLYNAWTLAFSIAKPDSNYSLYKMTSTNEGTNWTGPDTISTIGNNFVTTIGNIYGGSVNIIYESNKNGRYGIYSSNDGPAAIYSSLNYNYYGMSYFLVPFITEQFAANASVCIRKSHDSTKLILDQHYSNFYTRDSVSIGDSSKKVTAAMNRGIAYGDAMLFVVFNKDTANQTSLYYKKRLSSTGSINYTSIQFSETFILYQNYPNPFNPTTKIKFEIPKSSDAKIIIYDALGKEISNIFKAGLAPGSYEYEFSGENLSSGVYYYRLETNDFSKTMKMILIK